jgi:lipopolysaccharide exporter
VARPGQGGFVKNLLVMMSGTGAAQLISFAFSPALSRLYGTTEFGLFGCFLAVTGIIGAGVTLQYSQAIILPAKSETAARLFVASCCSAAAITGVLSLLSFLFPAFWPALLKSPELGRWLWLVPIAAFAQGLNQTLTAWCVRGKAFKRTATALVLKNSSKGCAQVAAGLAGSGGGGLIGGGIVADIVASVALWRWVVRLDGRMLRQALRPGLVASAAAEYKDFPFYSAPQNVLNAVSEGAPVLLLTYYYGIAVGGLFSFATRALAVPMTFLVTSLRQVLFQKLSEMNHHGADLAHFFTKCTAGLFAIIVIPALAGFSFAPRIFAFVFGSQWETAGEYARWLLIWLVPAFCSLPANLLIRIFRLQRTLLFYDLSLLIARMAVLVLWGRRLVPAEPTIAAFSIVGALFETWLVWCGWRALRLRRIQSSKSPAAGLAKQL